MDPLLYFHKFFKETMCFRQFWLNIDFQCTILTRIFVQVQQCRQICNTSSHLSVSASRSLVKKIFFHDFFTILLWCSAHLVSVFVRFLANLFK